ncbi:MAG: extracellular solute-binding protein, partial [Alphaproteobacteria bacterium]
MTSVSRSALLRAAAAAALLAATAGGAAAQGAGKTVYFLTWGGTVQQTLEKDGWGKKFTEATGYTVQLVPKATGPEIVAAAVAQKDKPQVDVVQTDLLPWFSGNDQGIFAPLDAKEIPNLDKQVSVARFHPNGVMTYGDVFAIIYTPDVFKAKKWAEPKEDWAELMRPEFRGMMVLPPINTTYG